MHSYASKCVKFTLNTQLNAQLFNINHPAAAPPEPGVCDCWGDPHVTTFDQVVTHFQGQCEHILARDNCENGVPVDPPTVEISYEGWKKDYEGTADVSWIKQITVKHSGRVSRSSSSPLTLYQ